MDCRKGCLFGARCGLERGNRWWWLCGGRDDVDAFCDCPEAKPNRASQASGHFYSWNICELQPAIPIPLLESLRKVLHVVSQHETSIQLQHYGTVLHRCLRSSLHKTVIASCGTTRDCMSRNHLEVVESSAVFKTRCQLRPKALNTSNVITS